MILKFGQFLNHQIENEMQILVLNMLILMICLMNKRKKLKEILLQFEKKQFQNIVLLNLPKW